MTKYYSISFFCSFVVFWLCRTACGILVPLSGIEPGPSAVRAQSPNHWTAREFPIALVFFLKKVPLYGSAFPLFIPVESGPGYFFMGRRKKMAYK